MEDSINERDGDQASQSQSALDSRVDTQDQDLLEQPNEKAQEQGQDQTPQEFSEDADEATRLASLAAGIRDQDDLERDIGRQADALLIEQADERDKKRLEKTNTDKARLQGQVHRLETKLQAFGNQATKNKYRAEIEHYKAQIATLDKDLEQIQRRIDERHKDETGQDGNTLMEEQGNKRLPGESQREFLIRTGKITPFSKMGRQLLRTSSSLADVMLDAEEEEGEAPEEETAAAEQAPQSHRNLLMPGFAEEDEQSAEEEDEDENFSDERPTKKRRLQARRHTTEDDSDAEAELESAGEDSDDIFVPEMDDRELAAIGESADEEEPEDADVDGDFSLDTPGTKRKARGKKAKKVVAAGRDEEEDLAGIDDGNEEVFQARLQSWVKRRSEARRRHQTAPAGSDIREDAVKSEDQDIEADITEHPDNEEEWFMPHPTRTDTEFEGGYRIPGDIYPSLFDYQKTGVQWLWELYSQQVGGIIGDEMGLGKTIQVISFLAGLHYSKKVTKPIIVVCPATVMKQWVNEFHRWWPPLRVSILHTSGSGMLDVKREARLDDDLESFDYGSSGKKMTKGAKAAKRIVDKVTRDGHVLVTTYSGLQTYAEFLIPTDWEYAVLDEGHKIRNPNTAITIYCKELRTHNRIILSGTPMQNNLTELWSLFDFIFPMRLGTLVNFRQQFEFPIKQGGYANASNLQVETAMKCAETLKDAISPYLLQRFKVDVASDLPKKSERVLFCKLTKLQRETYERFLNSEEMKSILNGKRHALYGVDILRKICNHPDLVEHKTLSIKEGYQYGTGAKSGKMQVVKALLEVWKKNGHKTLLFAQHRIMLDILEKFIQGMGGFNFLRMDGNTSIKDRQNLVDQFNKDPDLHVFLLTTKVGGLGVNLTGANRVIIYDPDWNPSTDVQARERAWRLGQKREVEIYRLMTAGTIEEKIYHRQIFKQFLTNKILKDPKQRQTFQLRDLHDLFTLGSATDGQTETGSIFKGTEVQLSGNKAQPSAADDAASADPQARIVNAQPTNDLDNIAGLSRQEAWRGEEDSEQATDTDADPDKKNNDDRVLSSIFARTGVQSALEHDAIINGRKVIRADPEIIAREAKRVAAQAARELQRSADLARSVPIGTPTWTGTYGSAGRPEELPRRGGLSSRGRGGGVAGRGGPSSASILANLSSRQGGAPASRSSSAASSRAGTPASQQPKGREFLGMIRDYLLAHGGKAYTQMLIDHFNRFCGTPQRTAEFKEMLKTIAELERGGRGRGKWVLREEYRPGNGAAGTS
ncbi:DNA repair protein rhp26 [Zalaria obscura]|uniref:DNA repair protein rhp26 n=1 Tax=Zalaria obscura TaxID=2024903 RepID=A0ACC3S2X5_9PEZI